MYVYMFVCYSLPIIIYLVLCIVYVCVRRLEQKVPVFVKKEASPPMYGIAHILNYLI